MEIDPMEPPPYESPKDNDASDTVHPTILVLAGRLIHSESASSAVLYELDRDVGFLSGADHKVAFSRHEPRVRAGQHGDGGVVRRTTDHQRHLFNLESPHAIISTSRYPFFLTSVSRKTLGHVGLRKTSVPRLGFKVMRIGRSGGEDEEMFEITHKEGRYEWWDAEGRRVAIEDCVDGRARMIVTTALERQRADVLVAIWCLRIWHDAAVEEDTSIFDSFKRKLGIGK
ncbi:hypothetical protein F4859DRAFT_472966 [Xylaria cf. heliscus]|nr:hypothetical protein F4859DRAFT_472966 [Xylaria cf. heliscus]